MLRFVLIFACGLMSWSVSLAAVCADEVEDVLTQGGGAPWYEPARGAVRPVPLKEHKVEAKHRTSSWGRTVSRVTTPSQIRLPEWISSLLWWGSMSVLALLVLAVAYFVIRTILNRKAPEELPGESWSAARVAELPFELATRPDDFLAAARAAMEKGDYREAVILLFSEQLMHLDRFQWIRLAKGKTNRQYLRELRPFADLREMMRSSVWLFEDVFFGGCEPDSAEVRAMWDATLRLKERYSRRPELIAGNLQEVVVT